MAFTWFVFIFISLPAMRAIQSRNTAMRGHGLLKSNKYHQISTSGLRIGFLEYRVEPGSAMPEQLDIQWFVLMRIQKAAER